jgi:hypothetical protein
MKFRFLSDPIFLASVALYALNRWLLRPAFPDNGFLHGYLTDLLCLPVFVPFLVWAMWRLKLRDDAPPRWSEIVIPLVFWSLMFEFWLPQTTIFGRFSRGDPFDIVAYASGGIFAFGIWKTLYRIRFSRPVSLK